MTRGPQRSRGGSRPSSRSSARSSASSSSGVELREQARHRVHERRLHHFTERPRAVQRRSGDEAACAASRPSASSARSHLRARIGESCCPRRHRPAASAAAVDATARRRCVHEAAGARPRPRRRRRRGRAAGTTAALARRTLLRAERIGHAIAIGLRDFLHAWSTSRRARATPGPCRRAAAAGRSRRGSAAAPACAARAGRAAARAAAAPRTSRARPARNASGSRCGPAPARAARSTASTMVPMSCHFSCGCFSMISANGPYSSSANRNVGVTGLPAATRWSVFTRPWRSSRATAPSGCRSR